MKKLFKISLITAAVLVLFSVAVFANTLGAPTGFKQTSASYYRVDIQWDDIQSADKYEYRVAETVNGLDAADIEEVYYAYGAKTPIYDLSAGKTYYVQVRAVDIYEEQGVWSKPFEVVTVPESNGTPAITQTGATTTSVKFSWPKYAGANKYKVVLVDSGSKESITKYTTTNSINFTGLSADRQYYTRISPIRKSASYEAIDESRYYGDKVITVAGKTTGFKVYQAGSYVKKVAFKWTTKKYVSGYQISMYNLRTKKTVVKTVNTNTQWSAYSADYGYKVDLNTFYKTKIRSYIKVNGTTKPIYSSWSNDMYFNVKPFPTLKKSGKTIKASWTKVTGATSYDVYIMASSSAKPVKVGTTTGTSMTIKKCGKSYLKKGKTYYVSVVPKKKVGTVTYKSNVIDDARKYCTI